MIPIIIITLIIAIIFSIVILLKSKFGGKNKKLKLGMRYEAEKKYHEALAAYDYALNNSAPSPELRWRIAVVSLKANLIQRTQKELSILISTGQLPENVSLIEIKTLMAKVYIKLNQVKHAFLQLRELHYLNPKDTSVMYELGKIYAGQREVNRAINYFTEYIRQNSDDGEAQYIFGQAYLDAGKPKEALTAFENALRYKVSDGGKVEYYLGILYYDQKKYKIALQFFNQALKKNPTKELISKIYRTLALCYKQIGLVDEAITNFNQFEILSKNLPKDSKTKDALYNQGVLLSKKGKYKAALEKFHKVKLMDAHFKDVNKIITSLSAKIKGEGGENYSAKFIDENPVLSIIKRGLLASKIRFDITKIEREIKGNPLFKSENKNNSIKNQRSYNLYSIDKFNNLGVKEFKDISRQIVKKLNFQIKSEPKFKGDYEYIDGTAINFLVTSHNPKSKVPIDMVITIRRYNDPISELSVSRFIEWLEEKQIKKGVFMGSATFTQKAFKIVQTIPNIKFIDRSGLAKLLGRIR